MLSSTKVVIFVLITVLATPYAKVSAGFDELEDFSEDNFGSGFSLSDGDFEEDWMEDWMKGLKPEDSWSDSEIDGTKDVESNDDSEDYDFFKDDDNEFVSGSGFLPDGDDFEDWMEDWMKDWKPEDSWSDSEIDGIGFESGDDSDDYDSFKDDDYFKGDDYEFASGSAFSPPGDKNPDWVVSGIDIMEDGQSGDDSNSKNDNFEVASGSGFSVSQGAEDEKWVDSETGDKEDVDSDDDGDDYDDYKEKGDDKEKVDVGGGWNNGKSGNAFDKQEEKWEDKIGGGGTFLEPVTTTTEAVVVGGGWNNGKSGKSFDKQEEKWEDKVEDNPGNKFGLYKKLNRKRMIGGHPQ